MQEPARAASGLTSIGWLTGLAGSGLLLLQVLRMARVPLVKRAFGQDEIARRHLLAAYPLPMLVHVMAITAGYGAITARGRWATLVDITVNYPGMLLGMAGTVGRTVATWRSTT